jgi:Cu+-exporting ATPase
MNQNESQISELLVEGMSCSNCAMGVRKRLEKQGMEQVDVNFATGEVRFQNVPGKSKEEIKESIEDLGYVVIQANSDGKEKKNS